jgi:transposase
MKRQVITGIDVSAATLDVAIEVRRGAVWTGRFDNDATGHRQLVRVLKKKGPSARVVLEATGVYHLDVALALHATAGIEVMVANPRVTRDFARAQMQRSKTDRTDALSLLEFARRMEFVPWSPPASEILSLRALARHMEALVRMGGQERNRDHAATYQGAAGDPVREAIREHLEWIEGTVAELQEKALALIGSSPRLRRAYDHLVSVKGIAAGSAIALLAELAVLPEDMTARQWVAHAGLDPRREESGSSVQGREKISKVGNRHLRRALYMPALVAAQHEPAVRAYYQKLLARGKKPLQAVVAVMRKLLHALHGMLANDESFIGAKFFNQNG